MECRVEVCFMNYYDFAITCKFGDLLNIIVTRICNSSLLYATLCLNKKFTLFYFCDYFPSCKTNSNNIWQKHSGEIWNKLIKQDAQLSQRDRAVRCSIVVAKVEDWNWETTFYGHCSSIFNHCDIIGLPSYWIRWKITQLRAVTPFKVIRGHWGRYQSKALCYLLFSD